MRCVLIAAALATAAIAFPVDFPPLAANPAEIDRKPIIKICPPGQRRAGNVCVPNVIMPNDMHVPTQQKLQRNAPTFPKPAPPS